MAQLVNKSQQIWSRLAGAETMNRTKTVIGLLVLHLFVSAILLLPVFVVAPGSQARSSHESSIALSRIELPQKGHPKLESVLWELSATRQGRDASAFASESVVDLTDGRARVIIEAAPGHSAEAAAAAESLGVQVETTYQDLLQVVAPVSMLTALAEDPSVRLVRRSAKPVLAVVTEGTGLIGADAWNTGGWTGAGVKVAVLDLGFHGYVSLLGTELPSSVTARSFRSDEDISGGGERHGTACAEIVYDIAPDASLYLVNFDTEVEMGNAVDWLIAQGVDIISCSLGVVDSGPGDGTGPICAMVQRARAGGILWCNSAGNYAQRHWMGGWADTDGDNWHEFNPSADEANAIVAVAGEPITIYLRWDDPWGASSNDYDLVLLDHSAHNIIGSSMNIQDGDDDPVESIAGYAFYTGLYHVAIVSSEAEATATFHLLTPYQDLQYQVASGSLIQPADSASAMTLGAVHWNYSGELEPFSSQGPTKDGRIKPDVVAPDGTSTASYGGSDGNAYISGGNGFFGTSASTPHAAAAAALVKEAYPSYTPAQLQAFLEERAVDLGTPGKDNLFGSGRLTLPPAPGVFTIAFDAGPDVVSLTIDGTTYSPEELPVAFSWAEESEHQCSAATPVSVSQRTQYVFASWSDGDTTASRPVIVSEDAAYTANYKTQHYLTVGTDRGDPGGEGWYDEGTQVEIEATKTIADGRTRFVFSAWTVDGDDETDSTVTVTMDAPHSAVASYTTQHYFAVSSEYGDGPSGEGWYDEGQKATTGTPEEIVYHEDDQTRYVFSTWVVDDDAETGKIVSLIVDAPHTAVAQYETQHYLTVNSGYGEPTGQGWYDEGSVATVAVTSPVGTIVRKVFTQWSGDSTATTLDTSVSIDAPKTITAEWRNDYLYLYLMGLGIVVIVVAGVALALTRHQASKRPKRRRNY